MRNFVFSFSFPPADQKRVTFHGYVFYSLILCDGGPGNLVYAVVGLVRNYVWCSCGWINHVYSVLDLRAVHR